ncbi:MAG: DUF2199 domain-containing protein [Candidatus Woesebacteria bacterium]|nr:DUF2199 domain-containing protein [Candidatus Woesebacteria bacterium]
MRPTNPTPRDAVAQYPDEIAELYKEQGHLPDGVKLEEGYYCNWDNKRFFIHARATLPLKDVHEGIGFGLWVEVSKEDFDKYLGAENDDSKYLQFEASGKLANNWPGFENTLGLKARIKAINKDEKVYIWEVLIDKPTDPIFEIALKMQRENVDLRQRILKLVQAWMHDFGPGES